MTTPELWELYDRQLRQGIQPDGPGDRVERVGAIVRHVGATDVDWNGVVWSDLSSETADAAIASQKQFFSGLRRGFEWKMFSPDLPVDLGDRLVAAGFTPDEPESVLVGDVAQLPQTPEPLPGIHLQPVLTADDVDVLADVHEQVFGVDQTDLRLRLKSWLAGAPDSFAGVIAMAGDVAVSAARVEFPAGADFAGLWGGGTLPEWRGKGIYRALLAYRVALAAKRGYRYVNVDASPDSRPILTRLGLTELATTTPYLSPAP